MVFLFQGKRVIVAVPPSVITGRGMEFHPPLAPFKKQALANSIMGSYTKVAFPFFQYQTNSFNIFIHHMMCNYEKNTTPGLITYLLSLGGTLKSNPDFMFGHSSS